MTVLTAIRERFARRQGDAESQYLKLVSDSAAGRDSDPATLTSVLTATGRTMEQFIRDVEKIERRAAARLKLVEVEKLRPACEAACLQTGEAMNAVEVARVAGQKLIADAIHNCDAKSEISNSLRRQIRDLEFSASQDLQATADPSVLAEIDQLNARCRDIRELQNDVGRSPGCDPDEAIKAHQKFNAETAKLEERIEGLQQQMQAT